MAAGRRILISNQRLTFGQIEESLDGPLESFVTSFYLQLNEDYQRLNFEKRTYENFSVKPDHSTGKTEGRKLARLASPVCRLSSTKNKDGHLYPKEERTGRLQHIAPEISKLFLFKEPQSGLINSFSFYYCSALISFGHCDNNNKEKIKNEKAKRQADDAV
jgi:hypothetical protein